MTPRLQRWLLIAGILVIAAILAVPMRETIYSLIVIPATFIGWELGLAYHMLPQIFWWWLVLVLIFFILAFSMMPRFKPPQREAIKAAPRRGQVEDLSIWLGRAKSGVYFKWLVANRLGKLAYQILVQRESGRPRSVFNPLVGQDWQPSRELQEYLETGLHGSFSEFSSTNTPRWIAQPKTPLDYEVKDAVEFLESQVEDHNLPRIQ
jgi:hypothetical protein